MPRCNSINTFAAITQVQDFPKGSKARLSRLLKCGNVGASQNGKAKRLKLRSPIKLAILALVPFLAACATLPPLADAKVGVAADGVAVRTARAYRSSDGIHIHARLVRTDMRYPRKVRGHLKVRLAWADQVVVDIQGQDKCIVRRVVLCEINVDDRPSSDLATLNVAFEKSR